MTNSEAAYIEIAIGDHAINDSNFGVFDNAGTINISSMQKTDIHCHGTINNTSAGIIEIIKCGTPVDGPLQIESGAHFNCSGIFEVVFSGCGN